MSGFITNHRKVYHVNQGVYEYWVHHSIYGWQPVLTVDGENWPGGTYEYHELRHTGQEWKDTGWIGPLIKW